GGRRRGRARRWARRERFAAGLGAGTKRRLGGGPPPWRRAQARGQSPRPQDRHFAAARRIGPPGGMKRYDIDVVAGLVIAASRLGRLAARNTATLGRPQMRRHSPI